MFPPTILARMNDFTHVVQVNSTLLSKLHYLLCLRTLAAALQARMIRSSIHCDTVASIRKKIRTMGSTDANGHEGPETQA